jgi:predicted nucleotidyltransferase
MTLDELRATKRDAILAIAAKHGVSGIRVFGSFARGEARNDSDLDLLIEAGPVRPPFFPLRLPALRRVAMLRARGRAGRRPKRPE